MKAIKRQIIKFLFAHPAYLDLLKILFSNKYLANNGFYKKFILKKASRYAQKYPYGEKSVYIETTLNCNAKCIFCYHSKKALSGTMTMDLFKKIIDDCNAIGIRNVGLTGYGEPLMDMLLFERIQYLRKYDMTYGFITNGSLLDKKRAERLFELGGLKSISFSVNAYSKEVYEKMMLGLDRDITYKNIAYFLHLKEKFKQRDLIVLVAIVMNKLNSRDAKDFFKFWKRQRAVNTVFPFELYDRMGEDYSGEIGPPGRMHRRGNWLTPCKHLWGVLFIFFDGRVAPCCEDNDLRKLIIGDVSRDSLEQIYTGESLTALRRIHLGNKRSTDNICGKCCYNSIWVD